MMPSIIDDTGAERFLGNNPSPVRYAWPVYGDTPDTPLLTRDQVIAAADPDWLTRKLPPVADQNGYGMCNAAATATCLEYQRQVQGLPYVQLSGGDLYGRINGGRDQGSLLEDGLAESMRSGISSVATCPYLDWKIRHPEAVTDRVRFRVLEAFLCPTFGHVISAAAMGFGLISGVMWAGNYRPDDKGRLPSRGTGGAGGHAIFGFCVAVIDGEIWVGHQNSWTAQWGINGRFAMCEEHYRGQVGGWWAVRAVTTEGGDVPSPTT